MGARMLVGLVVVALGGACFPDPPHIDEGDTAEVDSSTVDLADSAASGDSSPSSDTGAEDSSSGDVADSEQGDGGCAADDACAHLETACGVARCVAGQCRVEGVSNRSCDDSNICTVDDRCTAGYCGGQAPSNAADFAVGFSGTGDVVVHLVAPGPSGGAVFTLTASSREVIATGSVSGTIIEAASGEEVCGTFVGELRADGTLARLVPVAREDVASCRVAPPAIANAGLRRIADGTVIVGGVLRRPFDMTGGRRVGLSPTGLELGGGYFVARLASDGTPRWVTTFLGWDNEVFGVVGVGSARLSVGPRNESYLSMNASAKAPAAHQLVQDDGSESTFEHAGKSDLGLVYAIGSEGIAKEIARITGPELTIVQDTAIADDGTLYLTGIGVGPGVEVKTAKGVIAIPTGVHDSTQAWVVALAPDSSPLWVRHFFVPPGAGLDFEARRAEPTAIHVSGASVWVAVASGRAILSRSDEGAGAPVGESGGGEVPGRVILVELAAPSGAVRGAHLLGAADTVVTGMISDELGLAVVGSTRGLQAGFGDQGPGAMRSVGRPFFARPGARGGQFVRSLGEADESEILAAIFARLEPWVASDGSGGAIVGGALIGDATVGLASMTAVTPAPGHLGSYVGRIGSSHWFDCRDR